jgi:Predicted hydrolases or acyltransferases (alpha/beta hydrolase superfamily)
MTSDIPISHFYSSQSLALHYVDWGNAASPPLLLIHGSKDHARSWDWVAQAFRDSHHVIAPDLRGHGDSDRAAGSSYPMEDSIYDLAELIAQKKLSPVSIVAHSLGGAISLLYAGAFPETVRRLVVIEGTWWSPERVRKIAAEPMDKRIQKWVEQLRVLSTRLPRRYPSLDAAVERMMRENPRLSLEQARHLTKNGSRQNDDGSFSWKYDIYVRAMAPYKFTEHDVSRLWGRIACPVLLLGGAESFVPDPREDGSLACLPTARVTTIAGAGHWPHHDKLPEFVSLTADFLR